MSTTLPRFLHALMEVEMAEKLKMITVRLPESLHESLKEQAKKNQTSLNQFCVQKLLASFPDEEYEPQDADLFLGTTDTSMEDPIAETLPIQDENGFCA